MKKKSLAIRLRIIETADQLFYRYGYRNTSFDDIVETGGIARGKIYYYFKTKDAILAAVINERLHGLHERFDEWDHHHADPLERLHCFSEMLLHNAGQIAQFGCPDGTLNSELGKGEWLLRDQARLLLDTLRDYLTRQFGLLGYQHNAQELALQMLARSQGIALLAHAYQDSDILTKEVNRLQDWLNNLRHTPPTLTLSAQRNALIQGGR